VLADTLLADTDDNKEEDINDKEEEDINNKEEDVDGKEEDIDNDKEENGIIDSMPPKLKQVGVTPSKKTVKKELGVEKLATTVSKKLKISTPACKLFSMKTLDGYMVKPYSQKYTNFVEVDVHVAGVLKKHAYKVDLSTDGLSMIWRHAIPDYFFESKWMMDMLKGAYHPDELHVVAHDNVMQQIWEGGAENNGVHFAPKEDVMVIQLGVVCTGNVRVKEFLKKVDEVIYGGHTHFQFNTIYSCKVRVMLVWTTVKKKARQAIDANDVNDVKEEVNSNGEDDDNEEMVNNIGSGNINGP
jgi:hypothetical protein